MGKARASVVNSLKYHIIINKKSRVNPAIKSITFIYIYLRLV